MSVQSPREASVDTVGGRLRRARNARSLTQAALAKAASLEQTTVSKIETGAQSRPDVETLLSLARALGVPLEWLQEGTGELPEDLRSAFMVEALGEQIRELDEMLDLAYVSERHTPTSVAYLRPVLLEHLRAVLADGPAKEHVETARFWLDAVDRMRANGRPVTILTIFMLASRLQGAVEEENIRACSTSKAK